MLSPLVDRLVDEDDVLAALNRSFRCRITVDLPAPMLPSIAITHGSSGGAAASKGEGGLRSRVVARPQLLPTLA